MKNKNEKRKIKNEKWKTKNENWNMKWWKMKNKNIKLKTKIKNEKWKTKNKKRKMFICGKARRRPEHGADKSTRDKVLHAASERLMKLYPYLCVWCQIS